VLLNKEGKMNRLPDIRVSEVLGLILGTVTVFSEVFLSPSKEVLG
jgi:hypothetical protein